MEKLKKKKETRLESTLGKNDKIYWKLSSNTKSSRLQLTAEKIIAAAKSRNVQSRKKDDYKSRFLFRYFLVRIVYSE